MEKSKLFQWINDSEAFEMMGSYNVRNLPFYEFRQRQDDFYITLLNRMFFALEEVENNNYSVIEDELKEIAKGLLVFSDNDTQQEFHYIDKETNQLYVAAIYYLIGYEAIASLLLKGNKWQQYKNKYAQTICFLLQGGPEDENIEEKSLVWYLCRFLASGNEKRLAHVVKEVSGCCNYFWFEDLDEFFDCHILQHVLRKFAGDNLWHDLNRYDLGIDWKDYINFSRQQGILQFLISQRDAINKGLLTFEHSFSLKMPTSAGKSYITELLVYCELRRNPDAKVLYLAPLRSLSHELRQRYEIVGNALNFECYAAYGGNSSTLDSSKLQAASLFITTPEFFSSMESGDENVLDNFTLVICDEGQLLDSVSRGIPYELLLSRIKKHGTARFLFISAIIPNIYEVNTWLGGNRNQVGDSKYRPCEIKLSVAERIGSDISLKVYDGNYDKIKYTISSFLNKDENKNVKFSAKRTLAAALALKASNAGSTLLFTYSKQGRYGCNTLCDELLNLVQQHRYGERLIDGNNGEDLVRLLEYIAYQYGVGYSLCNYVRYGFAYHNGALPQNVREYIEDFYRNKKLKLLVSNSTLAEGVNLPIRTLVMYYMSHFTSASKYPVVIDSTEIRNILGRVGRAGREKYGLVIMPEYNEKLFEKVVTALKGDGIHEIRGIFFELIQQIKDFRRELTDGELNEVIEKLGASTAIDTMLLRNYNLGNEAEVIEDSISDSLAYHLSDNDSKNYIRKAYSVRYHKVSQSVNADQVELLKASGLDVDDFVVLEQIAYEEFEGRLMNDHPTDIQWLRELYAIIYGLPTMKRAVDNIKDGDVSALINDHGSWLSIVIGWMEGKQYYQIAESLNIPVDWTLDVLNHVQYHFCMKLQGLIRYLDAKYDYHDDNLSLLPSYIRFGICREEHAAMIQGGLNDRIAIHMLGKFVNEKDIDWTGFRSLRRALRWIGSEAIVSIIGQGIPALSLEKVKMWLKLK